MALTRFSKTIFWIRIGIQSVFRIDPLTAPLNGSLTIDTHRRTANGASVRSAEYLVCTDRRAAIPGHSAGGSLREPSLIYRFAIVCDRNRTYLVIRHPLCSNAAGTWALTGEPGPIGGVGQRRHDGKQPTWRKSAEKRDMDHAERPPHMVYLVRGNGARGLAMDTKETGGRTGSAEPEYGAAVDELQNYLGSVHFIVGEGLDAARPWPGHDHPMPRRNAADGSLGVLDHVELGRLVADWAADPASRPSDIRELASQLRGVATLPDGIRRIRFVEEAEGDLTIRLPAVDVLDANLAELSDPMLSCACQVPPFYADQQRPGIGPMLTPVDMFLARLGDMALGKA